MILEIAIKACLGLLLGFRGLLWVGVVNEIAVEVSAVFLSPLCYNRHAFQLLRQQNAGLAML